MSTYNDEIENATLPVEDKYVLTIQSADLGRLRITAGTLTEATENSRKPWRKFRGIKIHYYIPPHGKRVKLYKYVAEGNDADGLERRIRLLENIQEQGKMISSEKLKELLDNVS
jgi:hypothetical protein